MRPRRRRLSKASLLGGGPEGNELLTTATGAMLIVLLAVLGLTIVRIGQLTWLHLFLGLLLMGPVAVKMASTGYRFTRYYTRNSDYRLKGPPELALRAIAPVVVLTTVAVFASGVVLLFGGAALSSPWIEIHKVLFILWLPFTALHVLGHLPQLPASLRLATRSQLEGALGRPLPGAAGRWLTLAGSVAAGVVLALVLVPHFGAWTYYAAHHHHHHHEG